MTTALAALRRTAALAVLAWAALTLVERLSGPTVGANIGAGLAAMLVAAVTALVWGVVDGLRAGAAGPVIMRWGVVAVLAVPVFTAAGQLGAPTAFDWGLWATETVVGGWFWAVLVAVPALVGAAVGVGLSGRRTPTPTPTTSPRHRPA
ncbi:hypothetical protein KMZ32_13190 [Phycicoccus sp. MAQZ13P-2]|uniref:hypothetical protein n=1 Tax=Phycicoccus mangrovi TaxID=2840470 RepID=UPI001C00458E|nr:hypothetical protein [Phycicoccus mangrovi]MBT9256822.1 hypothetical protein [Phycicoccus mangrovi]MBT9275029.1 hypothetical protein [Phycicoccus mangrovi]